VTGGAETALLRVQRHVFEDRPPHLSTAAARSDHSVTLVAAPTESREAREVARVIVELVQNHGLRFDEIAVLLRDPVTYGPLLSDTLLGLGIPCVVDRGLALLRTQAGQSLHLLCQVLMGDYTRSQVLEFLGVAAPPFTALLGELGEYARPAQWEAYSLEAGIVRGAKECHERLSRLVTDREQNLPDGEKAEDVYVLRSFAEFMQGFLAAGENLPRLDNWQGWAEQTLRLLRAYVTPTVYTAEVEQT